jgi:hypothetical protein
VSASTIESLDTCVDVEEDETAEALGVVTSAAVGARVVGVVMFVEGATIAETAVGTLATKYG